MNKNRYRLIFNKVRAMLVPVAEDLVSKPSASAARSAAPVDSEEIEPPSWSLTRLTACVRCAFSPLLLRVLTPRRHGLTRWSILLSVLLPGAVVANLTDQGGNAITTTAANGVPVINIANPNANGLSHNQFQQFNVGQEGLIFNNSQGNGTSAIGGVVAGNANLTSGAASAILNEVTGISGSHLNGAMEVFGQKADLFIANQNGITVNGVSTINANSLTLTTGRVDTVSGKMPTFDVNVGHIGIGASGVNTEGLSYFDIVAKTIDLVGSITGSDTTDIKLVAGSNSYDSNTRKHTALGGVGSGGYAISASAAGAMYGNHISLISSDSGMGVKTEGKLTSANDIDIDANGDISVKQANAGRDIKIKANDGNVSVVDAHASETLSINGKNLALGGSAVEESFISGKFANLEASENITLSSNLQVKNATLEGSRIELVNSSIFSTAPDFLLDGVTHPGGLIKIKANQELVMTGKYTAEAQDGTHIDVKEVTWDGSKAPGGLLVTTQQGNTINDAQIGSTATIQAGKIEIVASGVSNKTGIISAAGGEISIKTDKTIDNQGLISATNIDINAGEYSQSGASTLSSKNNITVTAGALNNETTINAKNLATFNVGSLNNEGHIVGTMLDSTVTGDLTTSAFSLMAALQNQTVTANNIVNQGTLSAGNKLSLTADNELSNLNTIESDGDLYVKAKVLHNQYIISSVKGQASFETSSQFINS